MQIEKVFVIITFHSRLRFKAIYFNVVVVQPATCRIDRYELQIDLLRLSSRLIQVNSIIKVDYFVERSDLERTDHVTK